MANDKAARLATALRANADQLRQHLPGGDTQLVSINDQEAALLHHLGGSGKRDPITGIISFDPGDAGDAGDGSGGPDSAGASDAGAAGNAGAGGQGGPGDPSGSPGSAGTAASAGNGTASGASGPSGADLGSPGEGLGMTFAPVPQMAPAGMPMAATPIGPGVPMPGASPMANRAGMANPAIPLMGAPVVGQSPNQALAQALRG
jgi:hypothetical protein